MSMENINWLEEVEKRQEDLLDDLFRLLKIPSVREDSEATPEAPVGPGPLKALEEFLKMAEEDGFETKQFGPWAGRIELGAGDQLLGILGHVDVVPEGTGWDTDPFEPVIKDDRIYARGSSDDKGPTVGAYFAIKLLRELGVEFNQRLHLIIGTDEESGWQCMDYYFEHAEMPDYGFSPDATFPIINGEKGNVSAELTFPVGDAVEGAFKLASFQAGLRSNMVPQEAMAVVKTNQTENISELFNQYITDNQLQGEVSTDEGTLTFEVTGKAAHGSTPEKGVNAGTHLARFLKQFDFDTKAANDFLGLLGDVMHDDFTGVNVGVAAEHEVMGRLSMNVGIIQFSISDGGFIDANFRYPKGTDVETIESQLKSTLKEYAVNLELTDGKEPHYVPADDPLVETLLDVYAGQTGFEAHELTIGGGTYGRLMPRGVAYGALFPDSIDTMHQANEFIAVSDLLRATAIYAEAIYRLTR